MRRLCLTSLLAIALFGSGSARACAPAPPEGQVVRIEGEEALIVWDPETRTEHFVRRADFSSAAREFGFLVPTPAPPELSEVGEGVFDALDELLVPEVVDENEYTFLTCCTSPFLLVAGAGPEDAVLASSTPPPVEVLSSQRVAGMDATVLRARDADALGAWLSERGYAMRPALVEWLRPYVESGFAVTAFRYAHDGAGDVLGSRAVRMTFASERPFYPYREPSDQPETGGRGLRVHLVTTGRMRGTLGASPWSATTELARPLGEDATILAGVVPRLPDGAWITTFLDLAERRAPEHDLAFEPAAEQVERVPTVTVTHQVTIPLPIEPVAALAGGVYLWRRRRRAKRTEEAT